MLAAKISSSFDNFLAIILVMFFAIILAWKLIVGEIGCDIIELKIVWLHSGILMKFFEYNCDHKNSLINLYYFIIFINSIIPFLPFPTYVSAPIL